MPVAEMARERRQINTEKARSSWRLWRKQAGTGDREGQGGATLLTWSLPAPQGVTWNGHPKDELGSGPVRSLCGGTCQRRRPVQRPCVRWAWV